MTRKPLFWVVFAVLSAAGLAVAFRFFTVAFPVLSLNITMDRGAALSEARALAERYGWAPRNFRQAASFKQTDPEVQTYVELEGGGRDAFVKLARDGVYTPYVWVVRHFAQDSIEESRIRFTPGGQPIGFLLKLPEDEPGTGNLDAAAARELAEGAAADWGNDLSHFRLLESSQRTRPGGRVDHTLVYERTDVTAAEARFRLRVVVAGSTVSEVTRFGHVPEAFTRRYQDMRSSNDAIALAAQTAFLVLFVLLGGVGGTLFLLRAGWVVWRPALAWGFVVATLMALATLNALPLAWMRYDTALPATEFLFQQIALAVLIMLAGAPLLAFTYLAGESLGRRAFPHHPQQWRFWAPEVAASDAALGRTTAAYLLLGLELGYVVLFYLGTSRLEGWWSPAEALVQPDLLAMFQPWLTAVATSLFAALWEESVFRAIPIACAALLGARFGRRRAWIWAGITLQALVFAASHANYPQQPPYARVVELFVPAFGWGVIYLYFGLIPTILGHFVYDLSLLSLPLFASAAPGVWWDRIAVILAALVPLAVVLRARFRLGGRAALPAWATNGAWSPPDRQAEPPPPASPQPVSERAGPAATHPPARRGRAYLATALGVAGALIWAAGLSREPTTPRLGSTRTRAITVARTALAGRPAGPDRTWRPLAGVSSSQGDAHRYVWQTAGESSYDRLLGSYLARPEWRIRFVDFTASPEERVEEFRVHVTSDGTAREVEHVVPEGRPGPSLPEDSARALATGALISLYGVRPGRLKEVGAEETARPARTDWTFTFADSSALPGSEAEARLSVRIAGDEIVGTRRYVHVPEEWARERRHRRLRTMLITGGLGFVVFGVFGVAGVLALIAWGRRALALRPTWTVSGVLFGVLVVTGLNEWPAATAQFTTAQPWGIQAGAVAIGLALLAVIASGAIGLVSGLGHSWLPPAVRSSGPVWPGAALGVGFLGVTAALAAWTPGVLPRWPDYSGAAALLPWLSAALNPLIAYSGLTALLLFLAAAGRRTSARRFMHATVQAATLVVAMLMMPTELRDIPVIWLGAAVVLSIALEGVLRIGRSRPALVPGFAAALSVGSQLEIAVRDPFPGSTAGAILAVVLLVAYAWRWARALSPARAAQ